MKNILNILNLLFGVLLFSFGSCGGDDATEGVNTAPSVPVLGSPANNKLCVDNSVSFEWNVSIDAENNKIFYQIEVATDNEFTEIVITTEVTSNRTIVRLDKGKAYYWRVKASDNKNTSSSYSETYSFYTEGVAQTNHLPFLPQLVFPAYNSVITASSVALNWTANDVDVNDILSCDIYLDAVNPPKTKVANSISETILNVDALEASKIYFWKVVVRDSKGGETVGQVWSFKSN